MSTLHYEDIVEGDVYDVGEFTLTRDDIIAFAEQYDPQPIHTDPEAAKDTMYGGLIASGWHTACLCMRQLATELLTDFKSMGAFGLNHLTWSEPVRPGDRLSVKIKIAEKRPSDSRPERGYVVFDVSAENQDDTTVLSWQSTNIFLRKHR